MTHVFGQSFPGHRTKATEEEFLMAVNPITDQILHFQRTPHSKKISLPFVSEMSKFLKQGLNIHILL